MKYVILTAAQILPSEVISTDYLSVDVDTLQDTETLREVPGSISAVIALDLEDSLKADLQDLKEYLDNMEYPVFIDTDHPVPEFQPVRKTIGRPSAGHPRHIYWHRIRSNPG